LGRNFLKDSFSPKPLFKNFYIRLRHSPLLASPDGFIRESLA